MKADIDGILRCPNCEMKFWVDDNWIDASKRITKCPICDEMVKIDSNEPTRTIKNDKPTIYYLVTYSNFVKGDSLTHANWVTKDIGFTGNNVWKNFMGIMCPINDGDRVHEVTMAEDIMDLDWKKTYMYAGLEEDFFTGWLSPDGEFVQSTRGKFDDTAEFIIGMSAEQLKQKKWLRLDKLDKEPYFTPRNMVTRKQYDWLVEHGYKTYGMEDFE